MKNLQQLKDEAIQDFDDKILTEAKRRCFASQKARIFWEGWGGEDIKQKWIKEVEDGQALSFDFIDSLIAKAYEAGRQSVLDEIHDYFLE